tara:strand:+ start:297 stop:578 length:282 start_codon:yes stop_codon:yes gene_type:complete
VQVRSLLWNLAETGDFCSADAGSAFDSSPEPVVLTRATHIREQIMANGGFASSRIFSAVRINKKGVRNLKIKVPDTFFMKSRCRLWEKQQRLV